MFRAQTKAVAGSKLTDFLNRLLCSATAANSRARTLFFLTAGTTTVGLEFACDLGRRKAQQSLHSACYLATICTPNNAHVA